MQNSKRNTDVKNRLLEYVGEGKGEMIFHNSFETRILPYVKLMTSVSSMREVGHSKPMLWDNREGWGGEGGRRGVQDWRIRVHPWLIHVDVCQKPPLYCKVISLQLK